VSLQWGNAVSFHSTFTTEKMPLFWKLNTGTDCESSPGLSDKVRLSTELQIHRANCKHATQISNQLILLSALTSLRSLMKQISPHETKFAVFTCEMLLNTYNMLNLPAN